jgi:hypothetical protein
MDHFAAVKPVRSGCALLICPLFCTKREEMDKEDSYRRRGTSIMKAGSFQNKMA